MGGSRYKRRGNMGMRRKERWERGEEICEG